MTQVLFLFHVGSATALGQPLELPIFLRSMTESLVFIDCDKLPLPLDDGLLAALDNGVDPDSPAALVEHYAYDWWNSSGPPDPNNTLNGHNLVSAMKFHLKQLKKPCEPPIPTMPKPKSVESSSGCTKCAEYREIASSAVAELEELHRFAEAAETSAQASWEEDMRRAQGLFILNQAILDKEVNAPASAARSMAIPQAGPSKIDGVRVHRKSKRVFNEATAELHRLKQLPLGSQKWTWGDELSAAEVRQLVPPPQPNLQHHSGYQATMPEGRYRKYFSPDPSHPSPTSAVFSPLADDIMTLPLIYDSHNPIDKLALGLDEIPTRRQRSVNLSAARVADADADEGDARPAVVQHLPATIDHPVSPAVLAADYPAIRTTADHPCIDADGHTDDAGIDADVEDTDTDDGRVDTGITPADLAGILWGSDSDAASDVPPSATAPSGHDVEADIDSVDVADADLAGAAWGSESDADADGSSSDVGPNADDAENAWDTDEDHQDNSSVPPLQCYH